MTILIPNKRLLVPARDVSLDLSMEVKQFIRMIAHKVDGRGDLVNTREVAYFPNLITDIGLDRIGSFNGAAAYCQVGTGTSTPTFGDTALANRIASSNSEISGGTTSQIVTGPPRYASNVSGRRFAAGVFSGQALSEVGFGWATSGSLYNRALIQDGGGSPTTITIQSDEILDVYLETRMYIPTGDSAPFVLSLGGVDYTFVRRVMRNAQTNNPGSTSIGWGLNNAPGSMPACGIYGDGAGGSSGAQVASAAWNGAMTTENGVNPTGTRGGSNAAMSAYVAGTYQRAGQLIWPITLGNISGGINVISLTTTWSCWQFSVAPNIPKTSDLQLILNVLQTWNRH